MRILVALVDERNDATNDQLLFVPSLAQVKGPSA